MQIIIKPLRKCTDCSLGAKTEAELDLFVKGKNRKFGRRNCCKVCFRKKMSDYARKRRERRNKIKNEKLGPQPLRKCRGCGLEAWTEERLVLFAKTGSMSKYCRRNQCKKCYAKEAREYRIKVFDEKGLCRGCKESLDRLGKYCRGCLDVINGQMRKHHWELRLKAILKLGGKCVKCDISDLRILTINHLEGRNYRTTIDKGDAFYRKILSGERSISDLEIRCYNCNALYEFEQGYRNVPIDLSPELMANFSHRLKQYI